MNEQIRQIAERIRGLRDIAHLSVETCAQDLGVPAETYRGYESGQADIPASFLYQVAGKFQVELSVPPHRRGAAAPHLLASPARDGRRASSAARTTATRAWPSTSSTRRWSRSSSRWSPARVPSRFR